ncbi:sulfurtransferase [Luteimonas terricola]|uniref:Thiosulfate sulfurtransferase n=1 Tax=Luteimonas terricola TaxID=645597 RepID=A0ABQ2EHJ0_9GAMM|nr:sulfurtransferase [Luteimonas terricola]GGK09625.1 thiosulfate sulfurtransferase [Luteimonas terricola]
MNRSPDWTTLVSPSDLAARLGDPLLVVLDARFSLADPAAGEAAWRGGHVPGAHYVHLDRDLSGAHLPGGGRHPWPGAADFGRMLAARGITPAHQVVAYDAADGAFAARAWCLLRLAGHARVAVLDGGFEAWSAQGLPVDRDVSEAQRAAPYPVAYDRSRLYDGARVEMHLAGGGLLLDARGGERFRGEVEPIDARAGHVPGAVSRPYASNIADGRFKSRAALAEEFADLLGPRAPADVVAMCGSGVTACHHLLAMAHAGLDGAGLYTGSWSGWIEDPARPVATGDR